MCEFIHGIFECLGTWFGGKWKQVCELWRTIAFGWKVAELTYSGEKKKKKRIEELAAPDPTQQPGWSDGSWGEQPSGSVMPVGDWDKKDAIEEKPSEEQHSAQDKKIDFLDVQEIMWIQFRKQKAKIPQKVRERIQGPRSVSASRVLSVEDVDHWMGIPETEEEDEDEEEEEEDLSCK